ncbi:hypothetical protein HUJ05_000453 [Dendroctonus ponderosae]|nr:hypothetical protein HUJ05_000453 [Dendroctonus ponderosae]
MGPSISKTSKPKEDVRFGLIEMISVLENSSSIRNFLFDLDFQLNSTDNDNTIDGYIEICFPLAKYLQTLHWIYMAAIIIVGLVGNFLSFLVLLISELKLRSSSYYLAALAASDFGFNLILLFKIVSFNEILNLFNVEGFCQFFTYSSSVCAFLSVWLTVGFTTERFIAVRYPLQRQYICTVSRAKSIVYGIIGVALVTQIHIFWMAGLTNEDGKWPECDLKPYYIQIGNIINWIDTIVTLLIPMFLILIMNISIAKVVFRSHNWRSPHERTVQAGRISFHHVGSQSSNSTRNSEPEYSSTLTRLTSEDFSLRRHRQARTSSLQVQHNINKMLLLISSVFVALNLPSYVLRLVFFFGYWNDNVVESFWCAHQLSMLLYYTNFSINFLLYAFYGKSFRACLYKMFRDLYSKLWFHVVV